jgi:hypothetical protein
MVDASHDTAMVASLDIAAKLFGSAVNELRDNAVVLGTEGVLFSIVSDIFTENMGHI